MTLLKSERKGKRGGEEMGGGERERERQERRKRER